MNAARPRRLDRGWFWIAILAALTAIVAGVTVAVLGYRSNDGPAATVSAYFAALRRGDAPGALAFGALPAGSRSLLTSRVLAEQQRIAPIADVRVTSSEEHQTRATVHVSYRLGFSGGARQMSDAVALDRHDGRWQLAQAALATSLRLLQANDRASILGAPIPDGRVLLFPGALPVTFDTPDLELAPSLAAAGLSGAPSMELNVAVSPAGRAAVLAATTAQLKACLAPGADPRCPLPSDRYVPGSVRGTIDGTLDDDHLTTAVAVSARGAITITGHATVEGTWEALTFENVAEPQHGDLVLRFAGTTYVATAAATPLHITWQQVS